MASAPTPALTPDPPALLELVQLRARALAPHAPLISAVVLASFCGLAAAALVWRVVDLFAPPPAETTLLDAQPEPPVDLAGVAERLAGAEPFGTVGEVAGPQTEAPDTRLNLELRGVIAAGESSASRAFIAEANGTERGYAVGATLPGGALLHSVLPDRVVLRRGEAFETLRLPREASGVDAGAAPVPNAISAREVRDTQQSPGRLLDLMRPVVATDQQTGRQLGYRIYPGRDPDRFSKLGFVPGDLIVAVNGQSLDDPARSMELMRSLTASDSITIAVERDGVQRLIQVPVSQ